MSPFRTTRKRRFGRVLAVVLAALVMLVGVFVTSASACSCFPDGEGSRYARADHVFTGLVLGKETLTGTDPDNTQDDVIRYRVLRLQTYKGQPPILVNVDTSISGATCGISLNVWETYLVFASGDASDRVVETGLCSGTRPASQGPPITEEPPTTTTVVPTPTTAAVALAASTPSPCAAA
ncbi:hypothetical protein L6E12_05680 [Actinokineospora sp. PR83]|uniref:hypothetical protein n=1 Tax=Actinokineospora sp. PR83 TaxID=2884908 RepID=UPI0027DEFCD0|nr:hypothetical protein [Actinokineospora sp. PR83]MCG8915281.1 hypothetical protein [Actinokineospora sp. PR83]